MSNINGAFVASRDQDINKFEAGLIKVTAQESLSRTTIDAKFSAVANKIKPLISTNPITLSMSGTPSMGTPHKFENLDLPAGDGVLYLVVKYDDNGLAGYGVWKLSM